MTILVDLPTNVMVHIESLVKTYNSKDQTITALDNVSLSVKKGEFVIIKGPSGSGKSTLLHIIGGISQPTINDHTKLDINGIDILNKSEQFLSIFRARNIGFVLQFYGLLRNLTVLENIMIAGYFAGLKNLEVHAQRKLVEVGLSTKYRNFPSQLSGGEQQRVAIARALMNSPPLLLCDEPTGNLDEKNGDQIYQLLKQSNLTNQTTIILVTHNSNFLNYATRVIELVDGQIIPHKIPETNK